MQRKESGSFHMESRILFFSEGPQVDVEIFNHTRVQKHAHVAIIKRMGRGNTDLGFYGYNFFRLESSGGVAILNFVWHYGDTLESLESLFVDLSTFHGHPLASIKDKMY